MLVTLFSARIIYGLHRINISLHTLGHFLAYLSKVAQELRLETLCHSECISINQDLSVAAVTSTYSNRYSLHLLAYFQQRALAGTFSSTMAKQPASSSAMASLISFCASASSLARMP